MSELITASDLTTAQPREVAPFDSSSKPALVTPHNTNKLTYHGTVMRCRAISFAVVGAVAIKDDTGATVVIPSGSLAAGQMHPLITDQVLATGTTASGIVAYF